MGRLASSFVWLVWLAQGLGLIAVGGLLLVRPLAAQALLPGLDAVAELELVELIAPLALGLGALTLQVLRPAFAWMRASLASAFTVSWVVAVVLGLWARAPSWVLVGAVAFAIGNLIYMRRPREYPTPPSARPSANDEAPMLGRFWGFQMLYYAACGVLALAAPEWVVGQVLEAGGPDMVVEVHILRFAAALYFTMAIVSHYASGAQTDETWRGFCQAFLTSQWTCALAMGYVVVEYSIDVPVPLVLVIVPNALLALVNTFSLFDRTWIRRFMARLRSTLVGWWSLQVALLLVLTFMAWLFADTIIEWRDADELLHALIDALDVRPMLGALNAAPAVDGLQMAAVLAQADLAVTLDLLDPLRYIHDLDGIVEGLDVASMAALLGRTPDLSAGGQLSLAEDAIRLIAPLALGAASLTVLAILRRDRRGQHAFARLFVILGGVAVVMRVHNGHFDGADELVSMGPQLTLVGVALVLIAVNLLIWLFPDWRTVDERYRGAADTKPRWVYRLCAWQAVLFGAMAIGMGTLPDLFVELILEGAVGEVHSVLRASIRSAAPFWALMAATSAYAAAASDEWSWRGLCRWAALWQSAFVVTFVYVYDSHFYEQAVLILPTLLAGFAALNVTATSGALRVDDLAGQPQPSGWLMSDAGVGVLMALQTLWRRARPYHRAGVGATGTFQIEPDPRLPRAAFFEARAEPLLCTVRFSNRTLRDDAGLDHRGCALRLEWPDTGQPLDLLMSTGAFGPVSTLAQLVTLRWTPRRLVRRRLERSHVAREAAIAGLRRAPASYAALHYHTQLVRLWRGASAGPIEARRCRLRLIPAQGEESGLPDARDEDAPWEIARRPGEDRAPDYLHADLRARIGQGEPVRMTLQVQLSPGLDEAMDLDDAVAWYDPAVDWPLPWYTVGTVMLDRVLPPAATEHLRFDPNNGAGVIVTPLAPSWTDPRALAAAQDRVVRWLGELRLKVSRVTRRRR